MVGTLQLAVSIIYSACLLPFFSPSSHQIQAVFLQCDVSNNKQIPHCTDYSKFMGECNNQDNGKKEKLSRGGWALGEDNRLLTQHYFFEFIFFCYELSCNLFLLWAFLPYSFNLYIFKIIIGFIMVFQNLFYSFIKYLYYYNHLGKIILLGAEILQPLVSFIKQLCW